MGKLIVLQEGARKDPPIILLYHPTDFPSSLSVIWWKDC